MSLRSVAVVENIIRHPNPHIVPDAKPPVPIYDIMAIILLAIALVGFVNWLMGV